MTPAERMSKLFDGFRGAHGTHGRMTYNESRGGKQEIKKTARTLREEVTIEKWEDHLSGKAPLGIIPIREDNTCVWGCIDVDRYDLDLGAEVRKIKQKKLPLILCRSKSGGAHVFLFLSTPVPAEELRQKLKKIAAYMGWGGSEIFPKQNRILVEKGDLGSWLNMPYFGGNNTDRYAVKETSTGYSLDEFLRLAESNKVNLNDIRIGAGKKNDLGFSDGPPCLEIMSDDKFTPGARNKSMFMVAIYCKKKYGSSWKTKVEEYNRKYFDPPIQADEVADVVKRVESKDYHYTCGDQPFADHCNSSLCRGRKFGVGGTLAYPEITGLTKLETDPPIWFVDIDDNRIELTTKQLQNYKDFQLVCMDQLTTYFAPMKANEWAQIVGSAMEHATILEAAPEMSIRGHFMELLEDFCTNRHRGDRQEDLFLGKPWQDPETGRYYFRLRDLVKFLERQNFREWGRNTIGKVITEELGGKKFFNIKGKGVNTVYIENIFEETPETEPRKPETDPF